MKHISFFLSIIFICICFPIISIGAGSTIENGGFESDSIMWNTGAFSEDAPYLGLRSLKLSAPSANEPEGYKHSLSYIPALQLAGNTVYTLTFYARSTSESSDFHPPSCTVYIPTDSNQIRFLIHDLNSSWHKISVKFMVDIQDKYSLSMDFITNNPDDEVYIDEINLTPIDFSPVTLGIVGSRSITIPEKGSNTVAYTPVVIDQDGNFITIENAIINSVFLPEGVIFDSENLTITVDEHVVPCTEGIISCEYLGTSNYFPKQYFVIKFSNNLIKNGDFGNLPLFDNWNIESNDYTIEDDPENSDPFLKLTPMRSEDTHYGTVSSAQSFVLYSSKMYVFRANVRTDIGYESKNTAAESFVDFENKINITINEIGSETWNSVITAFTVPADGVYTLQLIFSSKYNTPFYIDNIEMQEEELKPSLIYFDVPMHVNKPTEQKTSIPIPFAIFDQKGTLCSASVKFSVYPEKCGVYIDDNTLIVASNATAQKYFISACLSGDPNVKKTYSVNVSDSSLGDSSFETAPVDTFWSTAEPSILQFTSTTNGVYPSDGNKLAKLTMNGPVSVLLSDSVYRYDSDKSYVFDVDIQKCVPDIDTVVTILVDNIWSNSFDDNLVVTQFSLSASSQHIQKIFTPSESVTGRLMIAFNTPDTHIQQIIVLDDVSVSTAKVIAENASISGVADVNKNIYGKYRFISNFGALDSSTFRWLVSDAYDGIYMPLEGSTDNTLSITSNLLDKYIKFEVTPVSMQGPVVGECVTSSPVRIGSVLETDNRIDTSLPNDSPQVISPDPPVTPKPVFLRGNMRIIDLNKFTVTNKHTFLDLDHHWAKDEIEILSAAGVVQGRGNGLFEPDARITRAEFSACIARAFELAPIYYDGPFTDVKPYNWYAGAVAVVTKHGFANGTSDTKFSPELPITREEMAAMIMRAYRKTSAQTGSSYQIFTDESSISSWAKEDVKEAYSLTLMTGFPDGNFYPKQNTTRAEAAVTIKRMLDILALSNQ